MTRSPLHELNVSLGARFVDFGGWEMPVQYSSVLTEHRAVRTGSGLFDVSHLGRFELSGPRSRDVLRRLLCNDIDRIAPGRCQYSMILNEDGGIVDDLIVWWWDELRFWVLPNAANHERVMGVFETEPGCRVVDLRQSTVMVAVQGPDAPMILEEVLGVAPGRFRTGQASWSGGEVFMAGTGYTGETGAEVCADPATAHAFVETLLERGTVPCGLGARDTLRLEAGLTLWGEDIDETTTPLEAGLGWAVSFDHDFVGRNRLARQKEVGVDRRLIGLVLDGRGIPRHGNEVRSETGGEGHVTSGNISPMLDVGVALAYVAPPVTGEESLEVRIRERWVPAHVAVPPFHTQR